MNDVENRRLKQSKENNAIAPQDFERIANELCEKALMDAKEHLHPLIRDVELDRLD